MRRDCGASCWSFRAITAAHLPDRRAVAESASLVRLKNHDASLSGKGSAIPTRVA
jgi:hypothetical protein